MNWTLQHLKRERLKVCVKCKEIRPEIDFYRNSKSRNGRLRSCRFCVRKVDTDNRKLNPEKYKKYDANSMKWRRENPERHRANNNLWVKKNSKKLNARAKEIREENPDRYYTRWVKRTYGITIDEYNRMLEKQNFKCKICGTAHNSKVKRGRLSVDHCHKLGHVRGLLCLKCNTGLGIFGDNVATLNRAIKYLSRGKE